MALGPVLCAGDIHTFERLPRPQADNMDARNDQASVLNAAVWWMILGSSRVE